MTSTDDDRAERLADAMRQRREALGLSQRGLAGRHVSRGTVQKIEAGTLDLDAMRDTTKRELERSLRVRQGAVDDVIAGRAKVLVPESPLHDRRQVDAALSDLPDDVRRSLAERIEDLPRLRAEFGDHAALEAMRHLVAEADAARARQADQSDRAG